MRHAARRHNQRGGLAEAARRRIDARFRETMHPRIERAGRDSDKLTQTLAQR
jgi:hypothetical protein